MAERDYWPTEGWRSSPPDEQGIGGPLLTSIRRYAERTNRPVNGHITVL